MESEGRGEEELACTEVFTWSNFDHETGEIVVGDSNSSPYCFKHVVKVAGSFYFLDVCANKHKVFAAFQAGSCPFEVGAEWAIRRWFQTGVRNWCAGAALQAPAICCFPK